MKRTVGEKLFNAGNILFLGFVAAITLYPFLNIAAISFNEGVDATRGGLTIWPRAFTLENYMVALKYPGIRMAALISISRTVLHTVYHLVIITMVAYAMSKKDLLFRRGIMGFFLIANYVSPGLIPIYLNYRMLHLAPNNYLLYILPGVFSLFNFAVIRTAIEGVPSSLEESALIDGAGYFRIFWQILVPLIKPSLAAIGLFVAVNQWNEWQSSMIYFSKKELWTLQYILQQILRENMAQEIMTFDGYTESHLLQTRKYTPTSIQMAIMMVTTIPIILVYPFIQRYFTKGMMVGAVKG